MPFEKTQSLKSLCAVLPSMALIMAHWFPWKRALGRDLHRLEAYAIGTAAIVGTALVAISQSEADDEDKADHIAMLTTAAVSAGVTTLAAWAVDALHAERT